MDGRIDTLEMYVPDIISAKITLDKVLSKNQIEDKVLNLEQVLDAMVLNYKCCGRILEITYSTAAKKIWNEKGVTGTRVRFIQKDVKGNVIEDMCCEGVLVSGETFFVSGERCASVNFGKGKEVYDITTLQFIC